jgi:hypothetical protein
LFMDLRGTPVLLDYIIVILFKKVKHFLYIFVLVTGVFNSEIMMI